MKQILTFLLVGCVVGLVHPPVRAAAPQKGPAFYSDVHGAGALIRSMNAMGKIDPKYYEIRDQAINWSLKQMRDFPTGGRTWLQNPSASKGHPSHRRAITTISAFNGQTLLDVYRETGNERYLQAVKANVDWLLGSAVKRTKPKLGDLYAWTSRHDLDDPKKFRQSRPLQSGHSWGVGSTLDALAAYSLETGDKRVTPYLVGGARFAYFAAEKREADGAAQCYWKRGDGSVVMGYCRGNSGTAFGLMKIAEAIPGAEIVPGRSIEDIVNESLNYILAEAKKNRAGIIWKNMNGRAGEVNLGYGRGLTGIGYTFWLGYQMNRRAGNEELARTCRDAARSTVDAFLRTVDDLSAEEAMTEFVGVTALVETIGACSGISGSYLWLGPFADEVRDENPEFAKRCDEAIRKVAYRLINTAYAVDGNYAWKNHNEKFGDNTINMAIDHGQTGAVLVLAEMGVRLDDPRIMEGARKAADFVIAQLVKDGDGLKMPHIVKLDPNAKRLVAEATLKATR